MMRPAPTTNLLRNALALVVGAILLILGFMFSVILIAVVAVVGLMAGAYFLWKTRHLRKAMRETRAQAPDGQVIEGESIVVEDCLDTDQNIPPGDSPNP